MTKKIMENVWKQMQHASNIDEDDKEIYLFGFYQGLILLLNIVTTLVIGIILNMFVESILFLIFFIPLRIFAGGYHAKTQLRCYVMSTITTVLILYLILFLQENMGVIIMAGYVLSLCVIWKLVPVQDKHKPLDSKEQIKYRKRVHKLLVFITGILGCLYFFGNQMIPSVMISVVYQLTIVLILGEWKNKIKCF